MKRILYPLLAYWFLACAHPPKNESEPTTPAAEFYPLEVGREWTYESQLLGEKREVTVRVVRKEGDFYLDSQGGQLRADAGGVRDRQRYLLQEPLKPGHTWTNVVSPETAEHYRVESVGEPCVAPAGRFADCAVVESSTRLGAQDGFLINRLTFAEGVGLARSEVFLERGGQRVLQSRLLLKAYLGPKGGRSTTPGS